MDFQRKICSYTGRPMHSFIIQAIKSNQIIYFRQHYPTDRKQTDRDRQKHRNTLRRT